MKKIVGIDLAGVEEKETGFAIIDTKFNTTNKVLYSDKEIMSETLKSKPKLVTIDAPLGLPKGRCCLDYECECKKYGYTRKAERDLLKIGIRIFPCAFAGMRKLTLRGIRLRKFFESKGLKVIETYPGSAQDMLGMPRKGKEPLLLQKALIKYGFRGEISKKKISHHELDAITSALVGKLYLEGKTLAFGIKEESQIITLKPKNQASLKLNHAK
jgi:hypothetical protein